MNKKTIYPTPWKPTMVKGIPRDYAFFAFFVCTILAALCGQILLMFPFLVVAEGYGYLKAKEDPEFFTVHAVRILKLKATKGDYKGREYIP